LIQKPSILDYNAVYERLWPYVIKENGVHLPALTWMHLNSLST
jgi:hypothetical protein